MVLQFWVLLSLVLIIIILLQIPKDNIGLTSFANKTDFLGSPTTAEKTIKLVTVTGILIYMFLAFLLNFKV